MKPSLVLAATALLGAFVTPAGAQNTTAEPPVITLPSPPAKTETLPVTTATPPATTPAETAPTENGAAPVAETVVVPQAAPAPSEPVTIDPDAAYPNGFADPADPFANDMSAVAGNQGGGFDWGLLGLLGLLGLIPLFRDRGARRVVYVERENDPRRAAPRDPLDR
jgi:hypothetical protein